MQHFWDLPRFLLSARGTGPSAHPLPPGVRWGWGRGVGGASFFRGPVAGCRRYRRRTGDGTRVHEDLVYGLDRTGPILQAAPSIQVVDKQGKCSLHKGGYRRFCSSAGSAGSRGLGQGSRADWVISPTCWGISHSGGGFDPPGVFPPAARTVSSLPLDPSFLRRTTGACSIISSTLVTSKRICLPILMAGILPLRLYSMTVRYPSPR